MLRTPTRAIVIVMALASAASADDGPVPEVAAGSVGPGASDWLRVGLERYERGNLVGAIDAFERGYQREARPMFLFALGQAHKKRGDCDRARAMFDAFLATSPPAAQADAALQQREGCEPQAPASVAAPAPAPAPALTIVTAAPARSRTPSRWRDPIAVTATGASVLLVGGGVALWLAAERAADGATAADTYDRHRVLRERASSRQVMAGVALGAGAAAGAVALWRLTRDRDERPRGVAWQPMLELGAGGVGVVLIGSFR